MILIVDDDLAVQTSLKMLFKQHGMRSLTACSPKEAFTVLEQHAIALVLLDMNFTIETSGDEGIAALRQLKSRWPKIPVILMTGWGHMVLAIEGMKLGAADFLSKPWDNAHLLQAVQTALSLSESVPRPALSRTKLDKAFDFAGIVGEDPQLVHILDTLGKVCRTDAPVLILGESGTGKELVAEALHRNSLRKNEAFIKVNLGGISQSLFESEMFGHKKGAFTNAYADRKGRFEMAEKGSIFLDEIGELDAASQVKMLRVLQDRKFEVLGSSTTRHADVRIISATNRNLAQMVKEERFREDLFFRINLITVYLPALRERKGDIPLLVAHFLEAFKQTYQRPQLSIHAEAMHWLAEQPFYGNIRELKNLVESTVLMCTSNELTVSDFKQRSSLGGRTPVAAAADSLPEEVNTLEELERKLIERTLQANRYKVAPAARALGISRNALYRKMDKYGIRYEPEN